MTHTKEEQDRIAEIITEIEYLQAAEEPSDIHYRESLRKELKTRFGIDYRY